MNKKRILYATIAVAIIMAITCPSRTSHRETLYNRTHAQAERDIRLAGDLDDYVFLGMECRLDHALDVETTYTSLLLFSFCQQNGRLISIGFLGNIISVNDIEL